MRFTLRGALDDGDGAALEPLCDRELNIHTAAVSAENWKSDKAVLTIPTHNFRAPYQPSSPLRVVLSGDAPSAALVEALVDCSWMGVVELTSVLATLRRTETGSLEVFLKVEAHFKEQAFSAARLQCRGGIMFLILASGPCKSSFLSPAQELKIHHSPKVELFQHSAPRVLKRRKTQALCMLFDIPLQLFGSNLVAFLTRADLTSLRITSAATYHFLEPIAAEVNTPLDTDSTQAMVWMGRTEEYARFGTFLSGNASAQELLQRRICSPRLNLPIPRELLPTSRTKQRWSFDWNTGLFRTRSSNRGVLGVRHALLVPSTKNGLDLSVLALICKTYGRVSSTSLGKKTAVSEWAAMPEQSKRGYLKSFVEELREECSRWAQPQAEVAIKLLESVALGSTLDLPVKFEMITGTLHKAIYLKKVVLVSTASYNRSSLEYLSGRILGLACRLLRKQGNELLAGRRSKANHNLQSTASTLMIASAGSVRRLKKTLKKHAKKVGAAAVVAVAKDVHHANRLALREPNPIVILLGLDTKQEHVRIELSHKTRWPRLVTVNLCEDVAAEAVARVSADFVWVLLRSSAMAKLDHTNCLQHLSRSQRLLDKISGASVSRVDKAVEEFKAQCFLDQCLYVQQPK